MKTCIAAVGWSDHSPGIAERAASKPYPSGNLLEPRADSRFLREKLLFEWLPPTDAVNCFAPTRVPLSGK